MKMTLTALISLWLLQIGAAQIETATRERGVIRFPDEWKTVNGTNFNMAILRGWDANTGKGKSAVPYPGWEITGGKVISKLGRGHVIECNKSVTVPTGTLPPSRVVDLTTLAFVMNAKVKDLRGGAKPFLFCERDWAFRIGDVEFEGRKIPAYDFGAPVAVKKPTATK